MLTTSSLLLYHFLSRSFLDDHLLLLALKRASCIWKASPVSVSHVLCGILLLVEMTARGISRCIVQDIFELALNFFPLKWIMVVGERESFHTFQA